MRSPRLFSLTLALAAAVIVTATGVLAGEVTPRLTDELTLRAPGELIPVIIIMKESVDHAALAEEIALLDKQERRAHVISSLRERHGAIQAEVGEQLRQMEAEGEVVQARSFWIAPMITAISPE